MRVNTIEPGWITKDEAIQLADRSQKTFERIAMMHKLEKRQLIMPGRRPIPLFRREDIENLQRPIPAKSPPVYQVLSKNDARLAIQRLTGALEKITSNQLGPGSGKTEVIITADHKHLLTMREAHELGWPFELLRALKRRDNPPGVRYGKRGFKFSAAALQMELEG